MKKLYYLIVLALILGLVLTGCSLLSDISQVPTNEQSGITYLMKNTEQNPFITDLIANGGDPALEIVVGDVLVWNNDEHLYVKYVITDPDWCIVKTHLQVAIELDVIPQTKKDNPIPGQFEKNGKHNCVTEVLYMYNLEDREWNVENVLFIAAHAVVQNDSVIIDGDVEPPIYQTETAWADGLGFEGKNWATYFEYTVRPPLTLNLYEKTPSGSWPIVPDGAYGVLEYYPCGSTFDFVFNGHGLAPCNYYTLINYQDWSVVICLDSGTADEYGDVHIEGSKDTGDLTGAKIWLVLSDDVDCINDKMKYWHPTKWLFEYDLIDFDDTDE